MSTEHVVDMDMDSDTEDEIGICAELGSLGPGAIITEKGLGELFGRHPVSVKRAINRGELPPPVKLFGKPIWTAGAIVKHIEERLAAEAGDRRELQRKTAQFRP